ncbi:hypothetical protein TVAG_252470 [Trichomonas vaginalis G3]|uniref:Uncharacterized protein n=1 Tax=Trichomonas vaginalis (strain ATCC PRA-98 / G3) TaxID=412133 RepID=A2DVY9_TRIV3|nr:hypothetical protein TVAGG3_0845880 [Trichomonas vaginalis G3]EAY15434.1 hypothetical protein TVAG_252470 [Trichomonas vaginalis G3]KAI5499603.1 hypothetical protein TVAGG3_0845880 [Trichomonas vaginalis G3]|eukprot:XP_001327657.1 hypothetical protein [Trichomonas vaginalis G3]
MTLRFQNYNNDVQGTNHNIEVFSSVFEYQITCPIFVEQQIDLSVITCSFVTCSSSRTMDFISTRTPSTVGFDGKIFKFEYISIYHCSSTNIGTTVSRSDKLQTYDHISCDSCSKSISGLNPNSGSCSLSEINISNFVAARGNGVIFIGNNPIAYRASLINIVNNSLQSAYFPSSRDKATENITIDANFINNKCNTSLLHLWQNSHLYENLCIFQNTFPTLVTADDSVSPVYTIIDSLTDNSTLSDILEVTDFTTNLVPDFTILFSPVPIYISVCVCQTRFNFIHFINVIIIL